MKILVLNGSPKREKSDTLHITRAFLEGLKEKAEAEIRILHVIDSNIGYCKGCFVCKRNGGICVLDDDMHDILYEILVSDILLFSFPLYCYGMPAPLKALLDRTMPLSSLAMQKTGDRYEHVAQADFSHLKYIMICGCGFPDGNFDAMVMQFGMMFSNNSTVITVPESPMFNAPEAVSVTEPFLEKVKAAGREYAENGALSQNTVDGLKEPMIPAEVYAAICNGE